MPGMTSPTSIKIGPMGQFNPNVPMFMPGGQGIANQILGGFGLQMPQISQDPVFQNTQDGDGSFLGQHPELRNVLSHAMMGAAFTPPSHTIGEGINNVAQGFLGAQNFTRERALQQFMAPFNVASTLSEIQGRQAQQGYLKGLGDFYSSRASNQRQVLNTHQTVDGKMFNVMEDGSTEWIKDPNGNILVGPPTNSQRPQTHAGEHPGGLPGQIVESMIGPPPDGSNPKALADWGGHAAQIYTHLQGSIAGSRAAAAQTADQTVKHAQPDYLPPGAAHELDQADRSITALGDNLLHYKMTSGNFNMTQTQYDAEKNNRIQASGMFKQAIQHDPTLTWASYYAAFPKQATLNPAPGANPMAPSTQAQAPHPSSNPKVHIDAQGNITVSR